MDFNFPQLDLSCTNNLIQDIQREQEKNLKIVQEAAEERNRKFDEARKATIETAANTSEMKSDLKEVIHNQNSYIKLLEKQNEVLKNIYASSEDNVVIQKEVMKILQEQGIDESTFKDKGLDVVIQSAFMAVQIWLKSKGIDF